MKDLVSIIILIFLGYLFITMKKKKNEAEAKGELIDDKGLAYVEVAMLLGSATFTGILFYNLVQPSIGMVGAAVFAMFGMAFNFGEPYAIRLIVATGQHNDKDRGLIPFYMISVALVKVVSIIAMSTVLYGLFTHNADKIRAMDYKIAAANERVKHINQSARNQLRSASQIKDPARRRQAVAAARSNQSAMSSRQYDQMANFEESKPINMQPTFAGFSIPRAIESSLLAVAWEFILTLLCVFNAKFISPISKPGLVKFAHKHLDWSVPKSFMAKMGLIGSPAPGVVKQDENLNANEPSSALADETKPAPLSEETYAEVRKEMVQRGFEFKQGLKGDVISPPNDVPVEEYQAWTKRLNAANSSSHTPVANHDGKDVVDLVGTNLDSTSTQPRLKLDSTSTAPSHTQQGESSFSRGSVEVESRSSRGSPATVEVESSPSRGSERPKTKGDFTPDFTAVVKANSVVEKERALLETIRLLATNPSNNGKPFPQKRAIEVGEMGSKSVKKVYKQAVKMGWLTTPKPGSAYRIISLKAVAA